MRKTMVVLKPRRSDHDKALREFKITSQGTTVAEPLDPERVETGEMG